MSKINLIIATYRIRSIREECIDGENNRNFTIITEPINKNRLPFCKVKLIPSDSNETRYRGIVVSKRCAWEDHRTLSEYWFKFYSPKPLMQIPQLLCYKRLELPKMMIDSEMRVSYRKKSSETISHKTNRIKNRFLKVIEALKEVLYYLLKINLKKKVHSSTHSPHDIILSCCMPDRYSKWTINLTYRHAVFRCVSV